MNDRAAPRNEYRRPWLAFAALVAGVLLAIQPLLAGHLPWRGDGLLHLYRLVELERAVGHGTLFPRWLPDLGYGFGFPLFNYYAPLSYYLLLPPRALGFSVPIALQVGYILALFSLCLGLFLWGRALFGTVAGLVAGFAAAYSPYFLYDTLHRGTLAEMWGLAWLALSLAALHHHNSRRCRHSLVLLSLAFAALILSHNILALVGTALLVAYALVLSLFSPAQDEQQPQSQPARLLQLASHPLVALVLGLGLATFFWLPALVEREFVQIEQLYTPSDFFYGNHFLSPGEVVALPRPADPAQVNAPLAFGLGVPQLLLALLAWLPRRLSPGARFSVQQHRHRLALAVAVAGLVVMALPISELLWDRLPLLYFVQFPWRFLGPASLLLALLAGAGASRLPVAPGLQLIASLLVLAAAGLPWLFPGDAPAELALAPTDVIRFEADTGWLGTTSAGEYLPAQVEALPAPATLLPLYEASVPAYLVPRLDSASLPPGVQILSAEYGLTDASITLEADVPFEVRFLWYNFPGWTLEANDQRVPTYAAGPHGLLAAKLPAGRQAVTLSFGNTPVQFWSTVISGLSLVVLSGATFLVRGKETMPVSGALPPRALASLVVMGLLLFYLKGSILDRQANPFVHSAFDGQTVQGVDVPLQVDFGGELLLLGFDLPAEPVPADESVEVTLYWRVPQPVATEYSVGLHLVDDLGRRYGQADSYHPAGYPTTRWLPGEYAHDKHQLTLTPGTPPGSYRLLVTVYEAVSGRRLPVRNVAGLSADGTYPLAEITVGPAGEQPSVASLQLDRVTNWQPVPTLALPGMNGPPEDVVAGDPLALTFFWQATGEPGEDFQARLQLVDDAGQVVTARQWAPGRDRYPTSQWATGAIIRDEQVLLVPAAATGTGEPVESGRYRLLLELIGRNSEPLAGGALDLGTVRVEAPARVFTLPVAAPAISAQFGELANLAAYELDPVQLEPGQELSLHVYWRAVGITETRYTVFVHLVGPEGEIVAQHDQQPAGGNRPTTSWLPGEIVADEYHLAVPAAAVSGSYRLRLGLYDPASGERMPVVQAGVPAGDHFFLPEVVEIVPSD